MAIGRIGFMENDIRIGNGYGFIASSGNIFLQRCFECGLENHSGAVALGMCAWCNFDANKPFKLLGVDMAQAKKTKTKRSGNGSKKKKGKKQKRRFTKK